MRVRIHRGAQEIGGNCVELEADGRRLVLDLGLPLDADSRQPVPLPDIEGLNEDGDGSLLGIIVSHAHPDHYGLLPQLASDVPVYIGEAAERILRQAAYFGAAPALPESAGNLADGVPLTLGPFEVTPLLVDHSAFDAYALLVEAGDRRLLYSGDFRAHGRKPGSFQRLIANPPADVNAMLLEGTRLSRADTAADDKDETAVERELIELMRQTEGLILALYSAQNIDRLVSIYRATLQADRDLVIDLYTAAIAEATGRPETIPQASWDRVRVYVPQSQRIRVKRTQEFERVNHLRNKRIYEEELGENPEKFVVTFRASMLREAERWRLAGARAIWSMWPGYLRGLHSAELKRFLGDRGIPLDVVHASGHARIRDLRALAKAVGPERVVPIHTAAPELYDQIYDVVEPQPDGQWWEV